MEWASLRLQLVPEESFNQVLSIRWSRRRIGEQLQNFKLHLPAVVVKLACEDNFPPFIQINLNLNVIVSLRHSALKDPGPVATAAGPAMPLTAF